MELETLLQRIWQNPAPDDLWQLQPHLLTRQGPQAEAARALAGQFYSYLSCVRSKLTSKQYSLMAASLAAGSVGVIAVQEVIQALKTDRAGSLRNLLVGGLAESLETASTLQHVQAWETEFRSVHEEAAWTLYGALWQLSAEMQPGLVPDARHALIESLLAPVRSTALSGPARMALVIRLFQVLLAIQLAPLLSTPSPEVSRLS